MAVKISSRILAGLRHIPLFGPLVDVRAKDHSEAAIEIGPGLFLSTAPIWFGAFLVLVFKRPHHPWFELLYDNIQSGEFCLYATAMLGPLYYFIFRDYKETPGQKFPSGRSFMFVAAIVLLLSSGLFAAQKAAEGTKGTEHLDHPFIVSASLVLYGVAILIVYVAHVYKNFFESGAANLVNRTTQDFVKDFIDDPKGKPS